MTSLSSQPTRSYHPCAQRFVFEALRLIQERLGRDRTSDKTGHITGGELLEGIRQLGTQRFGMLCPIVFRKWGVHSTDDFGHIVFRMIEDGEMRKTPDDSLDDFLGVYDFTRVFIDEYTPDIIAVA
jgi:uncharacterized repeat protein (TIGR04138 family)